MKTLKQIEEDVIVSKREYAKELKIQRGEDFITTYNIVLNDSITSDDVLFDEEQKPYVLHDRYKIMNDSYFFQFQKHDINYRLVAYDTRKEFERLKPTIFKKIVQFFQ